LVNLTDEYIKSLSSINGISMKYIIEIQTFLQLISKVRQLFKIITDSVRKIYKNIHNIIILYILLFSFEIMISLYSKEQIIVNLSQIDFGYVIIIFFLPFVLFLLDLIVNFNSKKITLYKILFLFVFLSQMFMLLLFFDKNDAINEYQISIIVTISVFFILLNIIFIMEIKNFINNKHSNYEIFSEFWIICAYGFSNILVFTFLYQFFGICCDGKEAIKGDFFTSLYFSIVTWTTLGYGDFSPIPKLRLIAAFEALLGYLYMAMLVGLFLNIIQKKRK